MEKIIVNENDADRFVEKSAECYHKTKEETLQNPIVREVLKSYAPGGINHKGVKYENTNRDAVH
jgi:hypothetical protein